MKIIMKNRGDCEDYENHEYYLLRKAFGDYKNGKVVVLKGSKIRSQIASSTTFKLSEVARKYREDNNYVKNNVVLKDIIFDSPTAAAQFVCGHSISGILGWRTESGKTLKSVIGDK